MVTRSLVTVVDDDESVRESLPDLLKEFGFAVQTFASAEEFLASDGVEQTRCLILDIAMSGMTGAGLQRELQRRAAGSIGAPWSACSSHSARPLCKARSMPRFDRADRWSRSWTRRLP